MTDFELAAPPKRSKKGVIVAGACVGALAGLVTWAWAHGTVADSVPLAAGEKPVCQLLLVDGATFVRGARIVSASPDAVWAAVTDYEHFKETFSFLRSVDVKTEADGKILFKAEVNAHVEKVDYAVRIEHAKEGDTRIARWEGAGGRFAVNRGSWRVTPAGSGTLVEYRIELQMKPYPRFIVNDVLLARIPAVLAALDQHVKK